MGRSPNHKGAVKPKPKWAKEQDTFQRGTKYPNCAGTFPDCPAEPNDNDCRLCPVFRRL
ncbi:MAG: hypothetical protein V1837_00180 [Candidatus Woesearchaeota archaeon]